MEELGSKCQKNREFVQEILRNYAQVKPAYGDFEVEVIFDVKRDHYQVVSFGWHHGRWVYHCVMHVDIRDGKIWIIHNATEQDIAQELVELGVSKKNIVLGFCPPSIRAMTEYGVG